MTRDTLDLHGIKHEDVSRIITEACYSYDVPFIVITGHSAKMKHIVSKAASAQGYLTRETISNSGRLIIDET